MKAQDRLAYLATIKRWMPSDVAFHPILGMVEVFYQSRTMPDICEVMTDKKIDIGDGRMSDTHIVNTKHLFESQEQLDRYLAEKGGDNE